MLVPVAVFQIVVYTTCFITVLMVCLFTRKRKNEKGTRCSVDLNESGGEIKESKPRDDVGLQLQLFEFSNSDEIPYENCGYADTFSIPTNASKDPETLEGYLNIDIINGIGILVPPPPPDPPNPKS